MDKLLNIAEGIGNAKSGKTIEDVFAREEEDYVMCNHVIDGSVADGNIGVVRQTFRTESNQIAIKWHGQSSVHVYNESEDGTFYVRNACVKGNLRNVDAVESVTLYGVLHVKLGSALRVYGSNAVHGRVSFRSSEICITGKEGGSLLIDTQSTESIEEYDMQPMLGITTPTGLSYGRWERAPISVKIITVENIRVNIVPYDNRQFTIGAYGYAKVPEIIEQGGTLLCPERTGVRWLLRNVEPPTGSTKMPGKCTYFISHEEDGSDIPWSEELIELRDKIAELSPEVAKRITARTYEANAERILKLLSQYGDVDVELLLQPRYISNWNMAECCCVLNIPPDLYSPENLLAWQKAKVWHIMLKGGYTEEQLNTLTDIYEEYRSYVKRTYRPIIDRLSPLEMKRVYEMIPELLFDFTDKSMEQCVREYLS